MDPEYIGADGADDVLGTADDHLRVHYGSVCNDRADNEAPGLTGVTEDVDGENRFADDPDALDSGGGTSPPFVDIGAYEVQECGNETCPKDLNNDGVVGPADLAQLLGAWGNTEGQAAFACHDASNRDGVIGPADLAALLGAWGPCP